jgi:hypothetical protein
VWDGKTFVVPDALGKPREDQLASTPLDNLAELSGRACYDSLGTGRKTTEYHAHIIEVGHGSVQEHANLTFLIPNLTVPDYLSCAESLLNRPGIYARKLMKKLTIITPGQPPMLFDLRITANIRAIREWFKIPLMNQWGQLLGETLQNLAKTQAPLLMYDIPDHEVGPNECRVVEPEVDEEVWVRAVGGKLEDRLRYSKNVIYNTFPFPKITEQQKEVITKQVYNILDEREKYPGKTLAELYDTKKMPYNLKQAHEFLDEVIDRIYRVKPFENDEERLAHLFKLYEEMVEKEKQESKK